MLAFKITLVLIVLIASIGPACCFSLPNFNNKWATYAPRARATQLSMCAAEVTIKSRLSVDMKAAMKAKEKTRLGAIRSIQAGIKQKEVDDQVEVDDGMAIEVMSKMLKQRKESIKSYTDGNRLDLAAKEQEECDVIAEYMPKPLSEAEIDAIVVAAIAKVGAVTVKDMGKVC